MKTMEFVHLVRAMRKEQKRYFSSRSAATLRAAKLLEAQVDKIVDSVPPPATQTGMFPEPKRRASRER